MRLAAAFLVALVLALPASAGNVQKGKQLFGRYCASCHGPNGEGSTGQRYGGTQGRNPGVHTGMGPSLLGVGALSADFYLRTGYMPLKSNGLQPRRSRLLLGPQQIDNLIAYVASLGKGPAVPKPHPENGDISQGMSLFRTNCAGCHQIVAAGGYVTGAVPPALGDPTTAQIAEAVRVGPYVMPAFSEKAISNAELDSIIKYVQYTKKPDNRGGWALGNIGPIPEGLVSWFIAGVALIGTCLIIGKRLHGKS
jgi:ubiquinol-cytochrome c reductase cytochrome c subunit